MLEVSQPKRYRDALGFKTFAELLEARDLPSRVTAFKLVSVVAKLTIRDINAYPLARPEQILGGVVVPDEHQKPTHAHPTSTPSRTRLPRDLQVWFQSVTWRLA